MMTYYDTYLEWCSKNNIKLPEWEGDRAYGFYRWMLKYNRNAVMHDLEKQD